MYDRIGRMNRVEPKNRFMTYCAFGSNYEIEATYLYNCFVKFATHENLHIMDDDIFYALVNKLGYFKIYHNGRMYFKSITVNENKLKKFLNES